MSSADPGTPRPARRLFVLLLLLAAVLHLFLIADHRLVRAHQTRLDYESQYALLSGRADGPALAAHGSPWIAALLLAKPVLHGRNFLPLFHLGLLAEELLLVAGCWMLSRRLFRSPLTAFFVGVSALGSAFWLDHAGLNLRTVSGLPMILVLLHRFLDDGSSRKLFLAGNLTVLQSLGTPPGGALAGIMAVVLYFAGRRFLLGEPVLERLRRRGWGKRDSLALLGIAATGLVVAWTAWPAAAPGAGAPRAWDVLVCAGLAAPLRSLEFLLGVNPSLDWSLYCGFFSAAFALVAMMTSPPRVVGRFIAGVLVGLLALGTALAGFYLCVPAFRPDAAPPFGTPLLRLLLVFLAGAGFERTLTERPARALRAAGILMAVSSAALVAAAAAYAEQIPGIQDIFRLLVDGEPKASGLTPFLDFSVVTDRVGFNSPPNLLGISALSAILAAGVLLLWASRPRAAALALALTLLLHPLDLMNWKFRMSWLETFSANPDQTALQKIETPPVPGEPVSSVRETRRYRTFHRGFPGWQTPTYAPRPPGPAESPAYWFARLPGAPPEPPPARTPGVILLGVNALCWLAWTLRSVWLHARTEGEPA